MIRTASSSLPGPRGMLETLTIRCKPPLPVSGSSHGIRVLSRVSTGGPSMERGHGAPLALRLWVESILAVGLTDRANPWPTVLEMFSANHYSCGAAGLVTLPVVLPPDRFVACLDVSRRCTGKPRRGAGHRLGRWGLVFFWGFVNH